MAVALPTADPDAAADRRRPEHHRRAAHVFGHSAVLSHSRSPRPSISAGNLSQSAEPVIRNPQPEIPEVAA